MAVTLISSPSQPLRLEPTNDELGEGRLAPEWLSHSASLPDVSRYAYAIQTSLPTRGVLCTRGRRKAVDDAEINVFNGKRFPRRVRLRAGHLRPALSRSR